MPIGDRSPWVFLHGFTQTHDSWWPTIESLVGHNLPIAVSLLDLPGHGLSPPPERPGLDEVARDTLALAGPGTYVGYSLGGRIALTAAVTDAISDSPRIERLVLISTTAGLNDDHERAARRRSDAALARRLVDIGTDAFLNEWLSQGLFDGLTPTDRSRRETNEPNGLAASLNLHGAGQMTPLWDRLAEVRVPTLIVVGGRDHKFCEIGERLAAALPNSERHVVDTAGHSVPLEHPDELAAIVADWARRTDPDQ